MSTGLEPALVIETVSQYLAAYPLLGHSLTGLLP